LLPNEPRFSRGDSLAVLNSMLRSASTLRRS